MGVWKKYPHVYFATLHNIFFQENSSEYRNIPLPHTVILQQQTFVQLGNHSREGQADIAAMQLEKNHNSSNEKSNCADQCSNCRSS